MAKADGTCLVGYKAFFVYGTTRRATTAPFKGQNSVDWVIRPYTYYYNDRENPVWLTDSVPLLGVRNGQITALENKVTPVIAYVVSGLAPDYTTLGINNCQGWSSVQTAELMHYGVSHLADAGFMNYDMGPCDSGAIFFYCVEQ